MRQTPDTGCLEARVQAYIEQPQSEWVTKSEAAARLGVSERTIDRRISRGELVKRRNSEGQVLVMLVPEPEADEHATTVAEIRATIATFDALIGELQRNQLAAKRLLSKLAK